MFPQSHYFYNQGSWKKLAQCKAYLGASPFLIHFWSYERENIMSLARLTVKDTVRSSIKVHLALISSFLYLLHVPLVHHVFFFPVSWESANPQCHAALDQITFLHLEVGTLSSIFLWRGAGRNLTTRRRRKRTSDAKSGRVVVDRACWFLGQIFGCFLVGQDWRFIC